MREIANDLPMRKQELRLLGVRKLQGTQQETRSLETGNHAAGMIKQTPRRRRLGRGTTWGQPPRLSGER
jgi:hypothetical protein